MPKPKNMAEFSIVSSTHSNLHIPRDAKRYKARKLQGMIRNYERMPVTEYKLADYMTVLEEFIKVIEEIKKDEKTKGLEQRARKAKVQSDGDEGAGEEKSSDVGVHVSTADQNPFEGL